MITLNNNVIASGKSGCETKVKSKRKEEEVAATAAEVLCYDGDSRCGSPGAQCAPRRPGGPGDSRSGWHGPVHSLQRPTAAATRGLLFDICPPAHKHRNRFTIF